MKLKLHWQIVIFMILGTIFGLYFNTNDSNSILYTLIVLCGDIFIRLLKMVIVPLIFTSIVIGVSSIKNRTKIGRLGIKTFSYYVMTSLIAILIGLFLANTVEPGIGATTIESVEAFDTNKLTTSTSILDILKRMIPINPFKAFADGDMLGTIFFALFFGITLGSINSKRSSTILDLINSF